MSKSQLVGLLLLILLLCTAGILDKNNEVDRKRELLRVSCQKNLGAPGMTQLEINQFCSTVRP